MSACEAALSKARNLKINECEAFFAERKIITIRITDSEIAEIKQNQEKSLAIRIIHQKRIGSAKTTDMDLIPQVIESALKSTKFVKPKNYWKNLPFPSRFSTIEKLYDKKLADISGVQASDIAQEMINSSVHQKISKISGSLNVVSEKIEIANTNGLNYSDKATYIIGNINTDSTQGNSPVSGVGSSCSRTMKGFSPSTVGKDAAEMCVNSLNPHGCEPGTYDIIFEPYAIGEMLAFVFSSNFNLKIYSEKRSCFYNKLGEMISSEDFSLIDDPHYPEGIGSKPFDDEGMPTKQRALIDSGIFTNTFSDLFHAFKEGIESSGNASRPGYPAGRSAQPIPFPSPHNLRIKANDNSKDEIIKDTKKGLLVGRLWYTYAVNPERGDFSCTARSGIRIIENGIITKPGKSVRIVHNLPVLLQNIAAVGNDVKTVIHWHSLPTITPSVKVGAINVIPI